MNNRRLTLALIVLGLVTAIIVINRRPPAQETPAPEPEVDATAPAEVEPSVVVAKGGDVPEHRTKPMVIVGENGERISVPPTEVEPEAHISPEGLDWKSRDWEASVEEIVASQQSPELKIDNLVRLMFSLPREGQVEIAHNLVEIGAGKADDTLAALLFSTNLHETVTSVLLSEMVKRPDAMRLPLLLDLTDVEGHPNQAEALELLELLLGQQHGQNREHWQLAIHQKLQNEEHVPRQ